MLRHNPQKKGVVVRVRVVTPRKPNSARRPAAKLFLSTTKHAVAHIPGSGHTLKRYSRVMIRGRGARDLPGVYCTTIRGVLDLKGLLHKGRRRSIYGVKKKMHLAYKQVQSYGYGV